MLFLCKFNFFDSWTRYSAEKEINNYISNHDTKKLKEISANNKTYQLLKHAKHVTIKGDTDNQGGGHIGYFTSTINGKEGALFVHLNFGLFPEIPKVTKLEVFDKNIYE
ncbi:hypothetical protein HMPREF9992_12003 [Staphylococcus epidermidis NIHLM070]|uniref:hypothetical protein n=1 Tax=Staphylococcus epidermidis TaxID=1282 RepID=UPI00026C0B9B|nr:hypothetical protein [Staphylococcus epidermidis]EJD82372.1 hypothetical protein HMPREF9992_12003 [Staphylococcus epidermidis NIHLM070]KSU47425.1 hypothetical protein ATE79_11350 [Staphylococcus epidermidis]UTP75796.1 hypothetical protein NFD60_13415 [Staphylococcus epidermidis]UTP75808.1 hypothetical protein NFD60_13305 [Staphylococcus epidermidis]UTP75814.1 hypothetical protein NFD60_13360 [Staphylococcus epidermidis]